MRGLELRELENVISSACITATGDFIDLADLPEQLQQRDARFLEGDAGSIGRSTKCARCTSSACWRCARAPAEGGRNFWESGRTSLYRYLKRAA